MLRGRGKVVFISAVTVLCVALIASVVLLTAIVVRRRLQQQQQQQLADASDDRHYEAAPSRGRVPPSRNWTSSSGSSIVPEYVFFTFFLNPNVTFYVFEVAFKNVKNIIQKFQLSEL